MLLASKEDPGAEGGQRKRERNDNDNKQALGTLGTTLHGENCSHDYVTVAEAVYSDKRTSIVNGRANTTSDGER